MAPATAEKIQLLKMPLNTLIFSISLLFTSLKTCQEQSANDNKKLFRTKKGQLQLLYLAEHKGIEYERVELGVRSIAVQLQEALALEDEDAEHDQLVDALAYDVPPHHLGDEIVTSADRWPLHHRIIGGLRGQCQGAEGVHDQVHPQQLHNGQRGAS